MREELAESDMMEAYLAARIDQAVCAIDAARATLTHGAGDYVAAARILQAVMEARTLRDELAAQCEYGECLRKQLGARDNRRAGSAFTATQAAKAREIVARFEGTETKNCPDCGITLPLASALCLCGHVFGAPAAPRHTSQNLANDSLRSAPFRTIDPA